VRGAGIYPHLVIFDPPAKRRTLLRVILPLVLIAAVVIAVIVSAAGAETRAEIEYLEELHAQASEISKSGDAMRDVVSRLQRISRTEFVTVIEGIRDDLAVSAEFVAEDPPTASLLSVRAMYRQALAIWTSGTDGFEASVLQAADEPENNAVVDTMAGALADLRAGDALYADLVVDMRRDDVPDPLVEMPRIELMPAEGTLVNLSLAYVDSARSPNNQLALSPGLAVSMVASDPEWQVNPSDQVVVPQTDSVVFSVVVTNVGNVRSGDEALVLTLTGGPEQVRLQADVSPLDPNQQVTLVFEPIAVEPGGLYEVAAELVVTADDSNLTDNEVTVEFVVNG
jgi:hypothetical protein